MRVLVIKGVSQYGGTRLFADEALAAFRRRGDEAEELDLGWDGVTVGHVEAASRELGRFDLVLSFSILGEFRGTGGQTLAELFGGPHVVWHTDYVLRYWDPVARTPASTALLVVDPTQIDALEAGFGPKRFERLRFFPHPAVGEPAPDEADAAAFEAARSIPILWAGGFVEPQRPWGSEPPLKQVVLDVAVEIALSVEWMPPHEALGQALSATGFDVPGPARQAALASAYLVDGAVRTRRRHALLMALAESGVPLHICGAGWEERLGRFNEATYHGAVPMTRMTELMRQSRVVLNTNGNFGAGSHERPFSASLAGAAVFSDISRYYETEFRPGKNIELFSWRDLPGAMDKLRALSADPERCWRYARSAKSLTLARHTWDQRVGDIIEAAGYQVAT
jgi:hypothetical protein